MHVPKLQHVLLKQFMQIKRVTINNINNYSTTSSSILFHTAYNDYSATSCTSNVQDLVLSNQQPILLKNVEARQYDAKVQNNCFHTSYPWKASHAILNNGKKHVGYKTSRSPRYDNIRHFSTGSTNSVAESTTPMQYSGIFKMLSESMPVKAAQDSLIWIHDCTGLPWWSVIILTTITMRTTVTLPLSLYQQYILAKLENLKQEMNEIIDELKIETRYAIHKYKWSEDLARRLYNHSANKHWNRLIVRENCHPAKASILLLVQIPLWVSLSVSIRNLCYMLPKQDVSAYNIYQEFTNGGFLWITDLTIADPFVLPIVMGLCNLAIIEINANSYANKLQKQNWKKYLTHFSRFITICLVPIAMYVPSCVSLYWATSSAFGLFQNLVLLSPKLRRFARVPITASESQNPYVMLRERIIARCRFRFKTDASKKFTMPR